MKIPRLANAIGQINDELIAAAERKKNSNLWLKWGSVAACLVTLVVVGAMVLPSFFDSDSTERYKNIFIEEEEVAIVWPWEYQTVYEKYLELQIDGIEYLGRGRAGVVAEDFLDELIGTYSVDGYDEITNEKHTSDFEVYQLKEVDKSQFVAVKMEDICYVFKNDTYAPPDTLGELLDLVDLPEIVELNRFSENGKGITQDYFTLNDDAYVWQVLLNCREAAFVEDQTWNTGDREYISFSITSETLGVYKNAMYVTTDGYLWTNAFDWQYLFYIGEDIAGEIIQYVKENSVKAEYEPYEDSVVGKIIQITEEYIVVDDSILCRDPAEGISYKVLLNQLQISRYIDYDIVKEGDIVLIVYEGEIDDNTIDNAISASKVSISGADIVIPE